MTLFLSIIQHNVWFASVCYSSKIGELCCVRFKQEGPFVLFPQWCCVTDLKVPSSASSAISKKCGTYRIATSTWQDKFKFNKFYLCWINSLRPNSSLIKLKKDFQTLIVKGHHSSSRRAQICQNKYSNPFCLLIFIP